MNRFPHRLAAPTAAFGLLLCVGCATTATPTPRRAAAKKTSREAAPSTSTARGALCVGTRESTRQQREVAQANARRLYFARRTKPRVVSRRHRSRFIAVQTVRNTESTGEATCMLFDVQNGQLVGTLVYDCDRVPQVGEQVKFTTYNATYVGG